MSFWHDLFSFLKAMYCSVPGILFHQELFSVDAFGSASYTAYLKKCLLLVHNVFSF